MILRSSRRVSRLGAMLLACSAPGQFQRRPSADAFQRHTDGNGGSKGVHFGTWGVDLGTRDLSVKPGDDFQRYAAGKWMDETDIPADKSSNGVGSEMNDRNQEQLRAIVAGSPADSQIGAFYKSYMDEARLEQLDARAAEGRSRPRRRDQDQGRVHETSWRRQLQGLRSDPVRRRRHPGSG